MEALHIYLHSELKDLISHASKVMLKILLSHLQARAEEVIVEEQTGF